MTPKKYFFLKLLGPRPTFALDMTPDERGLMLQHRDYMQAQFEAGKLVVYGPVLDPKGSFGMGIFDVAEEAEARRIMDADPTIRAGLNTYEVAPMVVGAARAL